jgi:hypothetical protein
MKTSTLMNTKQMLSDKEIKIFVNEAMKCLTKFMGQVHRYIFNTCNVEEY